MARLRRILSKANAYIEHQLGEYDKRQKRKQKYVRPTHLLLCECRKCEGSITTYARRINESE